MFYILDKNNQPYPMDNMRAFGLYMAGAERSVGISVFSDTDGNEIARVSTVFLAIDHGHGLEEFPVLFETMIFSGNEEIDDYQERCCFYVDALEMHDRVVEDLSIKLGDATVETAYPLKELSEKA